MNSTTLQQPTFGILPTFHEPPYIQFYNLEKNFDFIGTHEWFKANWIWSIYASIVYIIVIFGIQHYMQDRKPLKLKAMLTSWNLGLAIFSIIVLLRTFPEFVNVLMGSQNGFHNTLCRWTEHNYATAFWSYLFVVSKVVEFGDTVFIVLRKQKLIFLHWYHHIMTLISSCLLAVDYEPHQLWYVVMNSFIHTLMYSYFAIKASGVKVPRSWAMAITSAQLVQMVLGVLVNVYAFNVMVIQGKESDCDRGYFGLKLSFSVAMSYLFLFAHFFYSSYIKPKSLPKKSVGKNTNGVISNGHAKTIPNGYLKKEE